MAVKSTTHLEKRVFYTHNDVNIAGEGIMFILYPAVPDELPVLASVAQGFHYVILCNDTLEAVLPSTLQLLRMRPDVDILCPAGCLFRQADTIKLGWNRDGERIWLSALMRKALMKSPDDAVKAMITRARKLVDEFIPLIAPTRAYEMVPKVESLAECPKNFESGLPKPMVRHFRETEPKLTQTVHF